MKFDLKVIVKGLVSIKNKVVNWINFMLFVHLEIISNEPLKNWGTFGAINCEDCYILQGNEKNVFFILKDSTIQICTKLLIMEICQKKFRNFDCMGWKIIIFEIRRFFF